MARKSNASTKGVPWYKNYPRWFSDNLAKKHVAELISRFSTAPPEEKVRILKETHNMVVLYSMLIYKHYPTNKDFQAQINSDQELKANFELVKGWLDKHDGAAIADQYSNAIEAAFLTPQWDEVF